MNGQEAEDSESDESASDTYLIQAAHRNISRFVIQAWPGLPQVGDLYIVGQDVIQSLRCSRRRLRRRDDSDVIWEMECEYSSKQKEKEEEEEEEPLDKKPEIDIDFETYQTVAEGALILDESTDADETADTSSIPFFGRALVNTAGEPFDPQPEMDQVRPVMTITYNEAFLNIPLLMFYANTVNKTNWLGCPPRSWKMGGPRIRRVQEAQHRYWSVSLTFTFNSQGWDLQILNQGTYYLDGGGPSGAQTPFTDAEGNRIVGLLGDTGDEFNPLIDTGDATYSRYRVYKERDFNEIFTEAIFQ